MTHKINLEECEPSVREFFAQLQGKANAIVVYKDEKPCYFLGEIDNFPEEVRSLSNNQEFISYLDRCRDRAKTEGTLSLSEIRKRLAAES